MYAIRSYYDNMILPLNVLIKHCLRMNFIMMLHTIKECSYIKYVITSYSIHYTKLYDVGTVMKPITDKFKISRAKLAYIIDSTAAPVCILMPVSSCVITSYSIHYTKLYDSFYTY